MEFSNFKKNMAFLNRQSPKIKDTVLSGKDWMGLDWTFMFLITTHAPLRMALLPRMNKIDSTFIDQCTADIEERVYPILPPLKCKLCKNHQMIEPLLQYLDPTEVLRFCNIKIPQRQTVSFLSLAKEIGSKRLLSIMIAANKNGYACNPKTCDFCARMTSNIHEDYTFK